MAPHSSTPAWKIPWMEEPGRLQSEMATHSSVLAWRIPETGDLVGCRLGGHTELDTTEATWQQQHS